MLLLICLALLLVRYRQDCSPEEEEVGAAKESSDEALLSPPLFLFSLAMRCPQLLVLALIEETLLLLLMLLLVESLRMAEGGVASLSFLLALVMILGWCCCRFCWTKAAAAAAAAAVAEAEAEACLGGRCRMGTRFSCCCCCCGVAAASAASDLHCALDRMGLLFPLPPGPDRFRLSMAVWLRLALIRGEERAPFFWNSAVRQEDIPLGSLEAGDRPPAEDGACLDIVVAASEAFLAARESIVFWMVVSH